VAASQHTVGGKVLVKVGEELLSTGGVAPVAHEVAGDAEHANELDASLLHARVGSIADKTRVGTGSLNVGEDGVALGAEGEGKEGGADIGGDTGNDDLLLAGSLDGLAEFGVVPGAGRSLAVQLPCYELGAGDLLDLAVTLDERSVGVHFEHLLGQRTIGTLLGRSGHDNREIEDLAELGMSHHVVAIEGWVPVASNLVQANLQIKDEKHLHPLVVDLWDCRGDEAYGVVLVDALPRNG